MVGRTTFFGGYVLTSSVVSECRLAASVLGRSGLLEVLWSFSCMLVSLLVEVYVMVMLEGVIELRMAVCEQAPQLGIKQLIVITRNRTRERRCI